MRKFKLHPLFLIYCVLAVLLDKLDILLCTASALILHETAHYLVAKSKGFVLNCLSITPFGATLSYDSGLNSDDQFAVAVAGPAINLAICPLLIAVWWLIPASYPFTYLFCKINFFLALFNLIPVFPFDGGRIVLSITRNKTKCLKLLKILGFLISGIFLILAIISIFYKINYTLFFASFVIFWCTLFESKNERYRIIFNNLRIFHDFSRPFEKKELYVHGSAKLSKLLKTLSKDGIYTIHIVDNSLKTVRTLSGADVNALFLCDKKKSVTEAISNLRVLQT